MRLNEYLRADLVLPEIRATDTSSVLRAIARHLEEREVVGSAEAVEAALRSREDAHTTVMGHGMALPHATLAGLDRPVLLVALAPEPIQFGPESTDPVRLFFVLLSPPGREGEHIKLLARICRLVRHADFVDELVEVETGEDAVSVIRRADEQHV